MSSSENLNLRAALEKFVGCVNATGGVLQGESGQIGGCGGDPEWLDLADAYMAACEALGVEPKVELVSDDYVDGTESLLDVILMDASEDQLSKMAEASQAVVRASTGIRGRDVDAGIIDDDKTFDSELPRLNIRCECSLDIPGMPHAGGTTNLPVIRVEAEDDGSFTAVTNYWPKHDNGPA